MFLYSQWRLCRSTRGQGASAGAVFRSRAFGEDADRRRIWGGEVELAASHGRPMDHRCCFASRSPNNTSVMPTPLPPPHTYTNKNQKIHLKKKLCFCFCRERFFGERCCLHTCGAELCLVLGCIIMIVVKIILLFFRTYGLGIMAWQQRPKIESTKMIFLNATVSCRKPDVILCVSVGFLQQYDSLLFTFSKFFFFHGPAARRRFLALCFVGKASAFSVFSPL